jgi:FGGY-family pentulose kinase
VVASTIFSGMTGSALADASGLGMMEIRAMKKHVYDDGFSCAITAASATIGPVFPPSIPMIFYSMLSGASVGALFMGGMLPGILVGLALMAYIAYIANKRQYVRGDKITFSQLILVTVKTAPALFSGVILLGGIYSGIVTPTEAGALASLYAIIISLFVYRSVGWQDFAGILAATVKTTGILSLLVGSAYVFSYIVAIERIPNIVAEFLLNVTKNKYLLLLLINATFIILGMFVDTMTIILVFISIVLPLVQALGIDPVHFGVVITALSAGRIDPESVRGMSVDATCSLVALAKEFKPITVSPTGRHEQNVIVWMDHRAIEQADAINTAGHDVLQYVGGTILPEMQPPKLMWLKAHLPDTWTQAVKFMDLADYLVYRTTGIDRRSLCTSVCKWTYLGHRGTGGHYDLSFFRANHIEDIFEKDRVPLVSRPMGELAGDLTSSAAASLGLTPGIAVGVGIIDAHAGGIGSLGAALRDGSATSRVFDHAIALIGGTSSCHMAVSESPRFIKGIWGPYFGAMLPQMWLNEGGQSATGSLIDHVIKNNASYPDILKAARNENIDVYTYLNQTLENLVHKQGLTIFDKRHMLSDHHGNRSPRADAGARGMVTGLTLDLSPDEAAVWYGVAIHALAYGTREIIEAMNAGGYAVGQIYMCGGNLKNKRFIQDQSGPGVKSGPGPGVRTWGQALNRT